MVTLSITHDLSPLVDAIGRVRALRPALARIGVILRAETLANFRSGGQFPCHWLTSRAAAERSGQTLIKTATLRNSIHWQADANSVAVGTDVVYARVHQLGGRAGRNHAVTLPARPFLPIDTSGNLSPATTGKIDTLLHNWLIDGRAIE